ncbi:MAG: DHHA1 domain-containing protein [Candidatus Promineifilaceae bacterium]|nr:DHHA1 domain-containing protein [Candidatus Promineifilaceae bacterium]
MPRRWEKLSNAVDELEEISILLHDDPDPDAVAAGVGLCFLLEKVLGIGGTVGYRGVIGRAENKALVRFLQTPLAVLPDEFEPNGAVALIDTQPGAGNSPVGADYPVTVVVDHHGDLGGDSTGFSDVRPWIGASSTIITQYFRAAEVEPPQKIATGLFYGIKTDTKALSRDTSAADVAAYFYLLSYVDVDAVVEIENAEVPAAYFRDLSKAMETALIYDGAVISYLGETGYPDLTAEIADLFLRIEGVAWVVCMGVYGQQLYLSIRARSEDADAGELANTVVGGMGSAGGRNTLAGGQIPLNGDDPEAMAATIRRRVLDYLDLPEDTSGQPLVPQ